MKIQIKIDSNLKSIKIEECINFGEIVDMMQKWFPNDVWKEFVLEPNSIIVDWNSPIIIKNIPNILIDPNPIINPWPWWQPYTTCYETNNLINNSYNIEL